MTRRVRDRARRLLGRSRDRRRLGDELPHAARRRASRPCARVGVRRVEVGGEPSTWSSPPGTSGRRRGRDGRLVEVEPAACACVGASRSGRTPPGSRPRRLALGRLRPVGDVDRPRRSGERRGHARAGRRGHAGVVQCGHARPMDHRGRQRARPPRPAERARCSAPCASGGRSAIPLRPRTGRSGCPTRRSTGLPGRPDDGPADELLRRRRRAFEALTRVRLDLDHELRRARDIRRYRCSAMTLRNACTRARSRPRAASAGRPSR